MRKLQRSVYVLLLLFLAFGGLYFAKPFLVPLALAAVFSMLFIRLCNWLESKGMRRSLAALCCVAVFVLAAAVVAGLLYWQLGSLSGNIDSMKQRLTGMLGELRNWINSKVGISHGEQQKLIKQGNSQASGMLANFAGGLFSVGVNTVLVIVYMYLSLFYRSHIKQFILKLVPDDQESKTREIVHEAGQVAQRYLSGLGAMIGMLWVLYGIGFSLAGVESALFFAVLCGLLEIVPFIGNLAGTSLTLLAVIGQGGDTTMILSVIGVYFTVQFLQTYILEPLIVGEQVNINPLFTIMGIVLGEAVWGIAGMILAIPMLGIAKIICDRVPGLKPYGFLIGPEKPWKRNDGLLTRLSKLFRAKKEETDG
ncbi:AI-2E family transporter [Pedobacter yulinensis]|uniref:AI-2E family transporter n=1 Tax=Pedobacter yulinensis TaxID=2126353 RepID=A0A2T3HPE5_9SPHI|nr:AI-2E family transporter [Pedobacter yulinensis]PST84325.1 AI-2E family transporter [Pedobacter yulinensis]